MSALGDRVAAELEIRNLVARLAQLADTGPVEEYISHLTDDVVWEMPANPELGLDASRRTGHDDVAAGVSERTSAGLQGAGSDALHLVGTTTVSVDSDDSATGSSYFQFFTTATDAPTLRSMGRYDDVFRRIDGRWRLAHRTITFGGSRG